MNLIKIFIIIIIIIIIIIEQRASGEPLCNTWGTRLLYGAYEIIFKPQA